MMYKPDRQNIVTRAIYVYKHTNGIHCKQCNAQVDFHYKVRDQVGTCMEVLDTNMYIYI